MPEEQQGSSNGGPHIKGQVECQFPVLNHEYANEVEGQGQPSEGHQEVIESQVVAVENDPDVSVNNGAVSRWRKLAFATGHVQNDMSAAMWFTYILLFLQSVLQLSSGAAGTIMLVGQVFDGLSTVFVGLCSHWEGFAGCGRLCVRYGRLKAWHLLGTLCVALSFPFVFMPFPGDNGSVSNVLKSDNNEAYAIGYFCFLVIVFQFGWAVVQISHLSMIPEMSWCEHQRTSLTSFRYGATILSSVLVYCVTWAWIGLAEDVNVDSGLPKRFFSNLDLVDDSDPDKSAIVLRLNSNSFVSKQSLNENASALADWALKSIGPQDQSAFRNVALVSVGVGVLFSIIFHFTVPSVAPSRRPINAFEDVDDGLNISSSSLATRVRGWLTEPQFYQVAVLYTTTRLYVNISQAYMTFFVQDTLSLEAYWVAIIPLVMFSSGLVMAFVTKYVARRAGRKWAFLMSTALGLAGCLWALFGCPIEYAKTMIFFVAILYGAGGSSMIISSLSITADLISHDLASSAFVYGSMSFFDKVFNGAAFAIIQHFVPPKHNPPCDECKLYYKDIVVWFCGALTIVGMLTILSLAKVNIGQRRRNRNRNVLQGNSYENPLAVNSQEEENVPNNRTISA